MWKAKYNQHPLGLSGPLDRKGGKEKGGEIQAGFFDQIATRVQACNSQFCQVRTTMSFLPAPSPAPQQEYTCLRADSVSYPLHLLCSPCCSNPAKSQFLAKSFLQALWDAGKILATAENSHTLRQSAGCEEAGEGMVLHHGLDHSLLKGKDKL